MGIGFCFVLSYFGKRGSFGGHVVALGWVSELVVVTPSQQITPLVVIRRLP
ncbi:hypothetical protein TorRG33x02_211610, partial [Trema orientale]